MEYPEIPDGLLNTGGVVFKEKWGRNQSFAQIRAPYARHPQLKKQDISAATFRPSGVNFKMNARVRLTGRRWQVAVQPILQGIAR
jgi:hypothetical protein